MRLFAAVLTLASLAFGDQRTVNLVNPAPQYGMQEMATILRTVVDISKLNINSNPAGFDLQGSPAQLDAAAWVIHQLDKPAGWQPSQQERTNPPTRQFNLPPTEKLSVFRIYYLPNTMTALVTNETLTVLRTVLDANKVFDYLSLHALVLRNTAVDVEAAEWLLQSLDAGATSSPYSLATGKPSDLLRVFALPPDILAPQVNQLIRTLRTQPISISKVFSRTVPRTLAVRGTAAQLDQAARLLALQ